MHDADEFGRDANVLRLLAEPEQECETSRTMAVEKIWLITRLANA